MDIRMSKYPSQTQDKFTVRFPDGMRDEIAKRAEANGRSMNSEIVQILQDALSGISSLPMDEDFSRIYREVIEMNPYDEYGNLNYSVFDANNEKIDWLIDRFMERMDNDSKKFRDLLTMKKELSTKK